MSTTTLLRLARARALVTLAAALTLGALSVGCDDASASTDDEDSVETTSRTEQQAVWGSWIRFWNGDFTGTDQFISTDFRLHAALLDGSSDTAIHGVAGLTQWVEQVRAGFSELTYTTQVGPLIDGDRIVGRWIVTGTYKGGFPGAKATPGTVVTFTGTDILRVEDGKIAEYWLNSDTALLLSQLQVQ